MSTWYRALVHNDFGKQLDVDVSRLYYVLLNEFHLSDINSQERKQQKTCGNQTCPKLSYPNGSSRRTQTMQQTSGQAGKTSQLLNERKNQSRRSRGKGASEEIKIVWIPCA